MSNYCSESHKTHQTPPILSYNLLQQNAPRTNKQTETEQGNPRGTEMSTQDQPQPTEQENQDTTQKYNVEEHVHIRLVAISNILDEKLEKLENSADSPERDEEITKFINENGKFIRDYNTMMRRINIQTRGYDVKPSFLIKKEMEEREAKQKQEQQNRDKSQPETPEKSDTHTDSQPEEQTEHPDQQAQKLQHLHPDMQEYQDCLPKPPDPDGKQQNDENKRPAPIIAYDPKGFRPCGQMQDFFKSDASIKIAGGTYDAGKTYSCVAYMDQLARTYPNARLTFVHLSLKRVYKNIIPTYEKYLGFKPNSNTNSNPTPITRYGGENPEFYEYWNGSRIYINGLDDPQKLLSDFYDAAFVNQAELLPFGTWDELRARVSERAGNMPIAFLLGDCNPSIPNHWIRQQAKDGKLQYFEMTYKDNPEIYDQKTKRLMKRGNRRLQRLQDLDGLRYKRGYEGKWESAEGLVFDTFAPELHIVDNFDIKPDWQRYLSIDWGFRNPCSCIWWAKTHDDRIYAYKEIYKTGLTKPEFIRLIKENMDKKDRIRYAAVDSADQEGVSELKRAGIRVNQPKKSRIAQIDAIKERLKVDGSGKPSIFFFRDRLVHAPDAVLKEAYRPLEVTDEFLSCTYDENTNGTNRDDEAIKGDNHGIDSTAYFVMSLKHRTTVGSGRVIHAGGSGSSFVTGGLPIDQYTKP